MDVAETQKPVGKTLGYATLKLKKPLPKSGVQRIPVTEFGTEDPYTVMATKTVEFGK